VDAELNAVGIPVKADRSQGCSYPLRGTKYETLSGVPLGRIEDFEVTVLGADSARLSAS
jgi:hypothetical protein